MEATAASSNPYTNPDLEKAGIVRKKSSSKDIGIAGVTVGVLSAQSFTQPFLEDFAGLSPTTYDDEVGCLVALSICKFCCPVCDVHVAICEGFGPWMS